MGLRNENEGKEAAFIRRTPMNVKKILPIRLNYLLRHLFQFLNQIEPDIPREKLESRKRVFFLDAPEYWNIGDQAIAFAMEQYVQRVLPDYTQIEIQEDVLPQYINWLKKTIREDDLICLTGGGNMGCRYQRYEAVRRLIVGLFAKNRIIVFPQTCDYGDAAYDQAELRRARRVYEQASGLTLFAREKMSYERMKKAFPQTDVRLCPDIVLSMEALDHGHQRNGVALCMRDDGERAIGDSITQHIRSRFPNNCRISTTEKKTERITEKNRKDIVEGKLDEFARKELVLTDRLHGMIFSYVAGTPCIAFPNSNGKIGGVYVWIRDCKRVSYCETEIVLPEMDGYIDMDSSFFELKTALESKRNEA